MATLRFCVSVQSSWEYPYNVSGSKKLVVAGARRLDSGLRGGQ